MALHRLIIIPARLAATRLSRKPLADLHGRPMIAHVLARARAAELGPVILATDSSEIAQAAKSAGFEAVMTRADHASGSDRIWEALQIYDPAGHYDIIVNVQGDLPTLEPHLPGEAAKLLDDPDVDIGTLAALIARKQEIDAPHVVKVVGKTAGKRRLQALSFTRAAKPSEDGNFYHHIGVYAYKRAALEKFCALPPSPSEFREKLEQLRAIDAGMRIDAAIVDTVPLGVDTPEDLERAREMLK